MTAPQRFAIIDIARTVAIIAMAIFHFTYDLELLGFAPRGTMASLEWRLFAQGIAGSFLFLSGFSLVLVTRNGAISPRKYLQRLAMIGAGALAVTIGTYVAMGAAFVRFGILHHMFAASILGLVFLRTAFWINAILALLLLTYPHFGTWPVFGEPHWLWLGQTSTPLPPMVDYVPLIPWFGAFLLGMCAAQIVTKLGLWGRLANAIDPNTRAARMMSWPGQHTLSIYLIHQPVLFGCVFLARWLLG